MTSGFSIKTSFVMKSNNTKIRFSIVTLSSKAPTLEEIKEAISKDFTMELINFKVNVLKELKTPEEVSAECMVTSTKYNRATVPQRRIFFEELKNFNPIAIGFSDK